MTDARVSTTLDLSTNADVQVGGYAGDPCPAAALVQLHTHEFCKGHFEKCDPFEGVHDNS